MSESDAQRAPAASSGTAWVIVLTWNGWEVAQSCLDSLRPAMARGHRVLVVDNGSSDGTPERVRAEFPSIEVIENGANLGFAAGNNVGIRHALAGGAKYVVLMNQDAVAAPDCVDELVAAARRHPDAATVSAKIYFHAAPEVLWHAGGSHSLRSGRRRHFGFGERDRGRHDREIDLSCPCACAMLLTRRACAEVGPFDESLFLYGEEIDLAERAQGAGLRHVYAPKAQAWHRGATGTGGARSGNYLYYHSRNMLYLARKHRPAAGPIARAANQAAIVATMLASIVTMRLEPRSAWRALWQGVSDFRRGRMGPRPAG